MQVTTVKQPPLDYNPYDEDCCGSHKGETLTIVCDGGLILTLQEFKSGIGSEYKLLAKWKDQESKPFHVYVDDNGVLQAYVKVDA